MLNIDNEKKFSSESNRELRDGEILFLEGEDSREMYVVVTGEIQVVKKNAAGGEIILATLKKGDFVGEMSLLESMPRSATARAKGPTRLLAIQPGGFLLKIRRDPTFAFEMLQTMSRRIRKTNESLMSELAHADFGRENVERILNKSEFHKE